MYTVIRVSEDYQVILVALKKNANDDIFKDEMKFFVHNDNIKDRTGEFLADPNYEDSSFLEVSKNSALQYGSHIADGLGFGEFPEKNEFLTLRDVWEWSEAKYKIYFEKNYPGLDDKKHYLNCCWMFAHKGNIEGIISKEEYKALDEQIKNGHISLAQILDLCQKVKFKGEKMPDEEKEKITKRHGEIFGTESS